MSAPRAVVITGLEKSGKTPLRLLLDAQPWIRLGRFGWWETIYGRYGDLGADADLGACLDAIAETGVEFDRSLIMARIADDPARLRTYAGVFGLIAASGAEAAGVTHWGEQASEIEAHADEVLRAHPEAFIIHLLRDPRDVFAASGAASRAGGVGPLLAAWRRSVGWAERNARLHAGAYRVVRYEDLVVDPGRVVEAVAGDLGETAIPIDRGGTPGVETVGRYRERARSTTVAFIEGHAREEMVRLGYRPDGPALRGLEALRYRVGTWPLATLRTQWWQRRADGGTTPTAASATRTPARPTAGRAS